MEYTLSAASVKCEDKRCASVVPEYPLNLFPWTGYYSSSCADCCFYNTLSSQTFAQALALVNGLRSSHCQWRIAWIVLHALVPMLRPTGD